MKKPFVSKEAVLQILDKIGMKADSWAFAEVQRIPSVDYVEPGTPVFVADGKYRRGQIEYWVNQSTFRATDLGKIGVTVFFTEEEANKKIKEWERKRYDPHYDHRPRNNGGYKDRK